MDFAIRARRAAQAEVLVAVDSATGFARTPERDWAPVPDVRLKAFAITL